MRIGQIVKKMWLKEEDHNSNFFQVAINAHQNKTLISSMRLHNGFVLDSLESVHEGAVHCFHHVLYASQDRVILDLRHLLSHVIIEDDNAKLLALPLEEELKAAMKSIPTDSSPRPDELGLGFYLTYWEFLEDDLMEVTTELFTSVTLPRFFTTSFIVLLPYLRSLKEI